MTELYNVTLPMDELKGCPFCGAMPERREVNFWTGMRNDVLRVEFQHHCEGLDARQRAYMVISGVTEPEAIAAWNRRAPITKEAPHG